MTAKARTLSAHEGGKVAVPPPLSVRDLINYVKHPPYTADGRVPCPICGPEFTYSPDSGFWIHMGAKHHISRPAHCPKFPLPTAVLSSPPSDTSEMILVQGKPKGVQVVQAHVVQGGNVTISRSEYNQLQMMKRGYEAIRTSFNHCVKCGTSLHAVMEAVEQAEDLKEFTE